MKILHLHNSSTGLGDAVTGFYAAYTLTHQGYQVNYYTHHSDWLTPCMLHGVSVQPFAKKGIDMFQNFTNEYIGGYKSRLQRYLENIQSTDANFNEWFEDHITERNNDCAIPRPVMARTLFPSTFGFDHVVLAPYAAHREREWPINHYTRLAQHLIDRGIKVHVITDASHSAQLLHAFNGIPTTAHIGLPANKIIELVQSAGALVCNDSGIAHIGNLYLARTLVIMAALPFDFVFDNFTRNSSTKAIQPDETTLCSPCFFQKPLHQKACTRLGCSELGAISVNRVFNEVIQAIV